MYGKILLNRNLFDWCEKELDVNQIPFSEREALIWLLLHTTFDKFEGEAQIKNKALSVPYTLSKGEFYFSLSFLDEAWHWNDVKKVKRFLKKLVEKETLSSRKIYSYAKKQKDKTVTVNVLIYKFINWEKYQKFNTDAVANNVANNVANKNYTENQQVMICCANNVANNIANNTTKDINNESYIAICKGANFSDEKEMDSYDDLTGEILSEIENNSSNNSSLVYTNENEFKNTIDNLISFSLENIPLEYPDKNTFLFFCKNKLGFNKDDNYLIYNYDILSKNNWSTNNYPISNWKSYTEKIIVKNYNPSSFRNFTKNNSLPKVNKVNDSFVSYIEIHGKKLLLKKEKGIEYVSETGTLWSTKNEYCLNLC